MNHFSFELALIAVLPALALCGYVFFKDRVEKEPIGLLAILFGLGAVSYLPTIAVESAVLGLIDKAFADKMTFSAEGMLSFADKTDELGHTVLCAVFGVSFFSSSAFSLCCAKTLKSSVKP